jgi:hypothetical protein
MRAYIAYDDGGIDELGDADKEQVNALIEKAETSLATEEQFGIGFYRNKKDFLEIRPVGKSEYMIWSDIIAKNESPALLGIFSRRKGHIEKIVIGREAAAEVACYFMEYSREAFELKYS